MKGKMFVFGLAMMLVVGAVAGCITITPPPATQAPSQLPTKLPTSRITNVPPAPYDPVIASFMGEWRGQSVSLTIDYRPPDLFMVFTGPINVCRNIPSHCNFATYERSVRDNAILTHTKNDEGIQVRSGMVILANGHLSWRLTANYPDGHTDAFAEELVKVR